MSPRRASAAAILALLSACSMLRCESCGDGALSEDDRALRDAIREGDRDEARGRLEAGASASAAGDFAVSPRELVRGEPGDWLGSYLKYHQLLWVRFYEGDPVMCPPEQREQAAAPEPGARELAAEIGRVVSREAERISLSFTGVTPLHTAAFFCRPAIAELLLEHGAAADARDGAGLTPLHWAACGEVAEVLVAHGADVSAASTSGLLPLHTAIDADVVRVLLEHGARLDARDRCGNTPLHFASLMRLSFGDEREPLPREELPPDTPAWARLLVALIEDTVEIVRLLSERFDVVGAMRSAGADASAENHAGSTPGEVLANARSGGGDFDD